MSWSKSISLDVANKIFDGIGVSFEQSELEGAMSPSMKVRP
jgi:hypothetical protein